MRSLALALWVTVLLELVMLTSPVMAQVDGNANRSGQVGVGVDSRGGAVVDPTKNVLDLVEAAIRRQDDLRAALQVLIESQMKSQGEINTLRSGYDARLLKASTDRLESEARLRAEFAAAIAATEKDRVNAIRSVDVGAVAIATERATATANALAKTVQDTAQVQSAQVARSAEDLRALVATTAAETNRNIQQQFTAITTRISALEQTGATGVGRSSIQDPATVRLIEEVQRLSRAQGDNQAKSDSYAWLWGVAIAAIGLLFGGLTLMMNFRRPRAAA